MAVRLPRRRRPTRLPTFLVLLASGPALGCGAVHYAPPMGGPGIVRGEYDVGYERGRLHGNVGVEDERAIRGVVGGLFAAGGGVQLSVGDHPVPAGIALAVGLVVISHSIWPGEGGAAAPPAPIGSSPTFAAGFEAGYMDGRRTRTITSGIQGSAVGAAIGVLVYWYLRGYPGLADRLR